MRHGRMDEARLFLPINNFDFNSTASKNPFKQEIIISSLSCRAGRDCTQMMNLETFSHMLKTKKSFFSLSDCIFLKMPFAKNILTQAHRQTNILNCVYMTQLIYLTNYHTHGI